MRRTNKVPEAAFNWREEAACRGLGIESDLFFPFGTTGPAVGVP